MKEVISHYLPIIQKKALGTNGGLEQHLMKERSEERRVGKECVP